VPNGLYKTNDDKKSVISNDAGEEIESVVYTNKDFAKRIVDYFQPQFKVLC
jgi:hypothetical protein